MSALGGQLKALRKAADLSLAAFAFGDCKKTIKSKTVTVVSIVS